MSEGKEENSCHVQFMYEVLMGCLEQKPSTSGAAISFPCQFDLWVSSILGPGLRWSLLEPCDVYSRLSAFWLCISVPGQEHVVRSFPVGLELLFSGDISKIPNHHEALDCDQQDTFSWDPRWPF